MENDSKDFKTMMDEKLYSRNFKKWGFDLNPFVSFTAGFLVLALIVYAVLANAGVFGMRPADEVFSAIRGGVVNYGDWIFILVSNFFILVGVFLAFSRLGRVRLGGMKAKPEFSNLGWYSMLISAGMGIGLMFWAVGEPLLHHHNPAPIFTDGDNSVSALASTFLHWGFHPWAIYAVMALSLAFFSYNKNLPLSLRSVFYPVFKDKVFGRLGDVIDLIAVLATLIGLATSLGLGVQQINSGLNHLVNLPFSPLMQVGIILVVTAIAAISIISGIHKGVRFLSQINIKMAFALMVLLLLFGPTLYIIRLFTSSLGLYLTDFPGSALFLALGEGEARDWQSAWTVFYLAWWISWSPFVGMFIARVSKGRTIREFIIATLLVPSLLSFFWLSVFAGNAFRANETSGGALLSAVQDNLPVALFEMFQYIEFPAFRGLVTVLFSLLATVIIIFFFITSSDSGSVVVNAITSGGKTTVKSRQRLFWAITEGLIAATLILIGGERALQTLQDAVIITGLPFALMLLFMSFMLLQSLFTTYEKQKDIKDRKRIRNLLEGENLISLDEQEEPN